MNTSADAATPVHILGFSGSLRKGSYNTSLLRAAAELLPPSVTLSIEDISAIPMFNADLMAAGFPEPVEALRAHIAKADALLFATPEHNYSLPAVLKNAIDWASRPPSQPFNDKPAAIMGASPGNFGTVRCQIHLRQLFIFLNVHAVNKPHVFVGRAHEKIDAEGRVTDEATRKLVSDLVEALVTWTRRLRGG